MTGPQSTVSLDWLDGQIPVLTVDGIYKDPLAVRQRALALQYQPGTAHYPGRVARVSENGSLKTFLRKVVALVDRHYLPLLPRLPMGGRVERIRAVDTDFAVADVHPTELTEEQRKPHVDAVPIFGLIYLNQEDRGGTLFFRQKERTTESTAEDDIGYPVASGLEAEVCGRIEGRFNRLAIYPGFMPHSGDLTGDWISSDARFQAPRLTQRLMFSV